MYLLVLTFGEVQINFVSSCAQFVGKSCITVRSPRNLGFYDEFEAEESV